MIIAGNTLSQCHQCQDAAFAAVVRAHNQQHVFDRDHQGQRPEYQGDNTEYLIWRGILEMLQTGTEGVKRAGADVTIDHPQHTQEERHRHRAPFTVRAISCRRIHGGPRLNIRSARAITPTAGIAQGTQQQQSCQTVVANLRQTRLPKMAVPTRT